MAKAKVHSLFTGWGAIGLGQEMCTSVRRQTASSSAESVALHSEFATVAVLAEDLRLVGRTVGGVKSLVAHFAFEASLVELVSSGESLLSRIDRLPTLGALRIFCDLERHIGSSCLPWR